MSETEKIRPFVVDDRVRMKKDPYPLANIEDTKERSGMTGRVIAAPRGGEDVRVKWQDGDIHWYPWYFLELCTKGEDCSES